MRFGGAGNFCRVFAGLRQGDRIALLQHMGTRRFQRIEEPGRSHIRVNTNRFALQVLQSRFEFRERAQGHAITEMRTEGIADLHFIQEQFCRPVGAHNGTAQRQRRAADITAANIEGPRDRGWRRDHRRVGLVSLQRCAKARALLSMFDPSKRHIMGHDRRGWLRWPPFPGAVDRIFGDGDKIGPGRLGG